MPGSLLHPLVLSQRGFYHDQAVDELKQRQATEEEKRQMLNVLKRLSEFDSEAWDTLDPRDTDQAVDDLTERVQHLDLDTASFEAIWDCLSETERQEFYRAYLDPRHADGQDLDQLIWEPWWCSKRSKLVTEVAPPEIAVGGASLVPEVVPGIPPLNVLTKVDPHPTVAFQLVSFLFVYAYTKRRFNGDWATYSTEACDQLFDIEPLFFSKAIGLKPTCEAAIVENFERMNQMEPTRLPQALFRLLLDDILAIMTTPTQVLAALSDLYRLFDCVYVASTTKQPCKRSKHALIASKKVWYVLAYVQMLLTPPIPQPSVPSALVASSSTSANASHPPLASPNQARLAELLSVCSDGSSSSTPAFDVFAMLVAQLRAIKQKQETEAQLHASLTEQFNAERHQRPSVVRSRTAAIEELP
ncbi:hypothetical protein H4R34_001211 [Dimargaris verticillata]|uniref:Uncharacterized protein n=1 Tax=Dimargaris verticillata TaxID=2761393 RepID=A0A9W8BAB9_9FUNG|nr:hypothetical protein H4R34_001211 [Dimargaris verticillata]